MSKQRVRIQETFTWEFSGSYPDVPTVDGVDMDELLKKGLPDEDQFPFFVTLPIMIQQISGNRRNYDAAFQAEFLSQVINKRPVGNMGHIPDMEIDSAYPPSELNWVGAMNGADGMTWGKAYMAPGAARDHVRRLKATRSKICTSYMGWADQEWDDTLQAWVLSNFVLEKIDLAPPERAGLPDLSVIPKVTTEMAGGDPGDESEDSMNREEIIQAMTAADVALMPAAVVETIQAQARGGVAEIGQVQAVREALGLDGQADIVKAVETLRDAVAQQAKAAIGAEIVRVVGELVKADDEAGTAKATVIELVQAAAPETVEAVKAAVEAVLGREHVKAMLQAYVLAEMGPAQRRPLGQHAAGNGDNPYVTIPAE